ncbi:MAG: SulP family inorganic anion transporter [Thermodesulfobacteriota bacterium]
MHDQSLGPGRTGHRLYRFLPFLRWQGFLGWDTLRHDLFAGLTGAVIVLPQGVAFAVIAGLPPEYGLYTAIVPPVVAALFGSSLHLISGPTTAISIVVFSTLSPLAEPGSEGFIRLALTLTFVAGIYQVVLGLARMGSLVNFVSHSVVVGFTAGAAILIATSQLRCVLGLTPKGGPFLSIWGSILAEIYRANPHVLIVALATLTTAVLIKALRPAWPGLLLALIAGSLGSLLIDGESRGVQLMGRLPAALPPLSMPDFSPETLRELAPKGLAVALLGLIEALSIARSISTHSRQQIDGSQEFIGQGLSNLIGSFFSCYAASGSFTRSGINYHAGAMTPLSAVFASTFLALILLLVAPLTAYLPLPAMGGAILLVAYNLIDWRHIRVILRTSREESAVLVTTFLATLMLHLEFAVYLGVLLSLVLYLSRTSHPRIVNLAPDPNSDRVILTRSEAQCPHFKILRIDGSLFFGAVSHVAEYLYDIDKGSMHKSHVLIVAHGINFIDLAGSEMLVHESLRRRKQRGELYLCGLKEQAREVLERGGYLAVIGEDHIFTTETEAVLSILARIDPSECRRCLSPLFKECKGACAV